MPLLTIGCDNWDSLDSYGQIASVLANRCATKHGWQVQAAAGPGTRPDHCSEAVRRLLQMPPAEPDAALLLGWPSRYGNYFRNGRSGCPLVAVTMFESDQLPDGWGGLLNRCDAIVLPAGWLVDVFRRAGVTVPLAVVPLGIRETYRFMPRPASRRPFTFLTIATSGLRKGWDVAIRAFYRAFGPDPAYRLIVKLRQKPFDPGPLPPNIEVLAADLSDAAMADLYGQVDAAVFAARGEGFGLPAREAAATGLPVIATGWGGLADGIEHWGMPLRYRLTTAWPKHPDPVLHRCGRWAEPDETQLVGLMRSVAAEPLDQTVARRRSDWVCQNHCWNQFADGVAAVLKQVVVDRGRPRRLPRPQAVIHAHPRIGWHRPFAEKVSQGLRSLGVPHVVSTSTERQENGLPILLGTTCWRTIEADGPFLLVDRCSFGDPGQWVSLVLSGHGRRGDHRTPDHPDGSRWQQHGVPVRPWREGGRQTILCGQCETYSPHFATPGDWYRAVAADCSHFRPHPADRREHVAVAGLPRTTDWVDAGAVITLNSSVAIDAVLAGIATVTMDEAAMAWDVTGHSPTERHLPDRTDWLHWLAWTQWHHDEIAAGTPWRRFL